MIVALLPMLLVISPAKTLDFDSPVPTRRHSQPDLIGESRALVDRLRAFDVDGLRRLMDVSPDLAQLNAKRLAAWKPPFTARNSRPALYAFAGDVYTGLRPRDLDAQGIAWVQKHLRILSGLYGLLRPLDLMQPYRLEMGTRLETDRGVGLYRFWGPRIAAGLASAMPSRGPRVLVNLASDEYFRAVDLTALGARVVQPVFQESRGGAFKVIGFNAKRARGAMVRWAAQRALREPEALQSFDEDGYRFDRAASSPQTWVFRR